MRPILSFSTMRRLHLYLGCFFAPLLLFFTLSGASQTFMLHRTMKNGSYRAPRTLVHLSEVHTRQRLTQGDTPSSTPFRWLVAAMSSGLAASIFLGVVMALKLERALWVWTSLAVGALLPLLLLA